MRLVAHSLVFADPRAVLVAETLAHVRALGFAGVELIPVDFGDDDWATAARLLAAHGLEPLIGWSLGPDEDPTSDDASVRAAAAARMHGLIDRAAELGARVVAGLNYAGCGRLSGAPPTTTELARSAAFYREACDYAARVAPQLTLCLEPAVREDSHLINTVSQGVAFLDEVARPNAKLLLDTHQMLREERSLYDAITLAGDRIGYVHLSESHRGIVGDGNVPWGDVADALFAVGYRGYCGIEAFADPHATVASRAKVWRALAPDALTLLQRSAAFVRALAPVSP